MGGVVPYGYRKEGEKGQSRLAICDEQIPGFHLSEAEIVRTIYNMSAAEKKSCRKIADHLYRTGVPCASAWMTADAPAGKRKRRTAAMWRSSYVRNIIANRTYMGEHAFGKRTTDPNRKVLIRAVPDPPLHCQISATCVYLANHDARAALTSLECGACTD